MTVGSRDGLVTAATIFLSGFSAVWTDQAYWQRAIASQPATAVKGYVLGSFAWYAIPFAMSSTLGLVAAALTGTSVLPNKLSAAQVSAGLVGPAAAIALLDKVGAGLMVMLVFMATTSSTSAESIAASSLITFDIYKAYINPKATTRSMFWVSVFGLVIYGVLLAAISCIFHSVGISLNWLIKILGCLLGGGTIRNHSLSLTPILASFYICPLRALKQVSSLPEDAAPDPSTKYVLTSLEPWLVFCYGIEPPRSPLLSRPFWA